MTEATVFAGIFTSQPLVFAHLLDAADQHRLVLDLDHVEVIQGDPEKRLAHVFEINDAAWIIEQQGLDSTLVVVFPEALIPGAQLFQATPLLRRIGAFRPIRTRGLS
ncbi:MAG: hypothetical protein QNJ44_13590 [Rhodobacter sp.]|nr:hypothetical protein [Rhodobacter sp.]